MSGDDTFVGQILLIPFNFAPRGFALCHGQVMLIRDNIALFSLLGTTYGGDGRTTFALPDLRGRVPIGPNEPFYAIGELSGSEALALLTSELPAHTHALGPGAVTISARGSSAPAVQRTPAGNVPAAGTGAPIPYSGGPPNATMSPAAVALSGAVTATSAGGGQPHDNRQPYLTMNYCIALRGVFPQRQ